MKLHRKKRNLSLRCVHCKTEKTNLRIIAEDGKTEASYPVCATCQATHEVVQHPGALITLKLKVSNPQLKFAFGGHPAMA